MQDADDTVRERAAGAVRSIVTKELGARDLIQHEGVEALVAALEVSGRAGPDECLCARRCSFACVLVRAVRPQCQYVLCTGHGSAVSSREGRRARTHVTRHRQATPAGRKTRCAALPATPNLGTSTRPLRP